MYPARLRRIAHQHLNIDALSGLSNPRIRKLKAIFQLCPKVHPQKSQYSQWESFSLWGPTFEDCNMPKLIGGIAALVALAGGILNSVEPVTIVMRAGLAFLLGAILTQVWYVFFTVRVHTSSDSEDDGDEVVLAQEEPPPAKAA
jgi:hypothetical protein